MVEVEDFNKEKKELPDHNLCLNLLGYEMMHVCTVQEDQYSDDVSKIAEFGAIKSTN